MSATSIARFIVVGGGAALFELTIFQVLVQAGFDPVVANVLSFAVGMLTSFVGYRHWSFAGDHALPVGSQFGAYVGLALFNASASSLIIHGLVAEGMRPLISKACCMALIAVWNYLFLSRLVFRRRPLSHE